MASPKRYSRKMTLTAKLLLEVQWSGQPDEGCWEFTGRLSGQRGYGQIWHQGHYHYVHRVSYEEFVGPIPSGLDIDHLCRNPKCFRPDHLEPVTRAVNIQRGHDARRKELGLGESRSQRRMRLKGELVNV